MKILNSQNKKIIRAKHNLDYLRYVREVNDGEIKWWRGEDKKYEVSQSKALELEKEFQQL